jgi:putative DNA primase/helicase
MHSFARPSGHQERSFVKYEVDDDRATTGDPPSDRRLPEQIEGLLDFDPDQELAALLAQRAISLPASQVQAESVAWLWPGKIALGSLTLIAGDPGLGKSLLTCHLAAELSRGKMLGRPASTLMLTAEDSLATTVRPRLEVAGADLELVRFVQKGREGVVLPGDVLELRRLLVEADARLLVIDPLMAHLPEGVNSWKDQSVRKALAPLHWLAGERDAAIVLVAHLNKSLEGDPLKRIGGSIGLGAAVRSAFLLGRDPGDAAGVQGARRVLAHIKSNLAPLSSSLAYEIVEASTAAVDGEKIVSARLVARGESTLTGTDMLGTGSNQGSALRAAVTFLENELTGGPVAADELMEAAAARGLSWPTVKRAKRELTVSSVKAGFDRGWIWSLPIQAEPTASDRVGGP